MGRVGSVEGISERVSNSNESVEVDDNVCVKAGFDVGEDEKMLRLVMALEPNIVLTRFVFNSLSVPRSFTRCPAIIFTLII